MISPLFRPARSRRRAFTLIEAIAAVVILAVGIPAMLWSMRDAARRRVDPILQTRARWLAAERLEEVIADRHSTARGYAYVITGNYPAENPVSGFTGMSRSVVVAETNASFTSGTGYKTVTVSVTFTDSAGTSRTLSLSTVLTSYTP